MLKTIVLERNKIRVIYGELLNDLDIDWTIESLDELQKILEFVIEGFEKQLPSLKKKRYKNLRVYAGGNHIDIVDYGVGSLNLLRIEDHHTSKTIDVFK